MAQTDYYQLLGVSTAATITEIKSAYRRLAMKNHPDRNSGNPVAEEKFKAINRAYDVLGDEQKKKQYDYVRLQLFQGNGAYDSVSDLSGGMGQRNPFSGCGGFGFKGQGCRRWRRK